MTFVEANKIAHEFASSFGEIVIGFKYGYNDLKEYSTKYYADFCFLTLDGKIPNEPPLVGGACGFTIDKKSKQTNVLNFGEYIAFQNFEIKVATLYQEFSAIKSGQRDFSKLKVKYNLSSKDLLKLKRLLSSMTLEKEFILEQLAVLLKNK